MEDADVEPRMGSSIENPFEINKWWNQMSDNEDYLDISFTL